ncbi:alpha/beta hydrolase [Streptomyces kronopolitis]|uniref:alpha/beta hydrolase n=1 Tax=Streptomyces kronopolitis TaxID=1612435 RepID=UPI0020BD4EF6|nr:alpha/beta hydrolase-fold protein [Streptomyces kronopolitis]MCL6297577.1 alpha/beta hydrolase-fold protein [Streptomyces kronopolitis]
MGLTSRSLEYAVAAAAVVCVGLTLRLWPRFAGRGARPLLGRLGVIAGTQLVIVAALGLAVNANFQFYASWHELLGLYDDAPAAVGKWGDGGAAGPVGDPSKGLVQASGPDGLDKVHGLPKGAPATAGRVESVRIVGKRTRAVDPAYVYLPPQYFQPQYARQRFPVVVALSGYPGGTFLLGQHLRLPQTADGLIRAGRMQPTVIVMMRPTIAPPRDTQCVDVPGGPQAETFFARDVPDALRSHYRVGHDPGGWGVMGYSSGGSCALQLAMRHDRTYTSAAALSPDYKVSDDPTTGDLFGGGRDRVRRREEHDLMWRLRRLPAPRVDVLIGTSRSGEKNYPAARAFLAAVKPPMTADSVVLAHGSHNFATWRRELPATLEWMSRSLTFPEDVVGNS